ncbi:sporulation protein [Terrilactibacillus sp. BCM23-1]|uniref:Sporulation protein n=1 Tax=Terrilactibacillus tamarindi TaxID=2599694 RepID=A0A6N8CS05_9BACI|nr:GerMN domain-containing protein [Terrilactibacillus tamarindi]MTT31705.1 sporulation protein [Terrilactibacillus tamarindi]
MRKRIILLSIVLSLSILLSGCGLNLKAEGDINPKPDKIDYVKNNDNKAGTVPRELYLLDASGHLSPQVVNLPKSTSSAKDTLNYLVKDGPVSNILPNGFMAVLPADTMVNNTSLKKDGTFVVDFSKDLLSYRPSDEAVIFQSITWTLTQFKEIKRVQFKVDGKIQDQLKFSGKRMGRGLIRKDGINSELGQAIDMTRSQSVTVYYLAHHHGQHYYVPVTTRVPLSKDGAAAAAVNALIEGPPDDHLTSTLGVDVALTKAPVIKNGVAILHFNKALFSSNKKKSVSREAINCLALTLTGQPNIKKVKINVEGSKSVMLDSGEPLTVPVSRPVVNKTGV